MEQTAPKQRYRYIDYFKALAIILVILGHINFANRGIRAWVYAFHMPAFFFVSGMVLKNTVPENIGDTAAWISRRFKSLIFPYFIWAMIYMSLEPKNIVRVLWGSHQMLSKAGTLTSLWFLTSLFLADVYFEIAKLIFKERFRLPVKVLLMIGTFTIAALLPKLERGYPWNVNVSFCAFGFLLAGNILAGSINELHRRVSAMKKPAGALACLLATALAFAGTYSYKLNFRDVGGIANMAKSNYGSFPMFLLAAFAGTLLICAASFALDVLIPETGRDLLAFIGINTFSIFVTHKPIVRILFKKVFTVITASPFMMMLVTTVGTLLICCGFSLFINRYIPLLAGKVPRDEKGRQK